MNIETVGTEADRVIDALPVSYMQDEITRPLSIEGGQPEESEFQAILQEMIEPLGSVNLLNASNPPLPSDLSSTIGINAPAAGDSGEPEAIRAIEGAMSGEIGTPLLHPQSGSYLSAQNIPLAQDGIQPHGQNPEHQRAVVTTSPEPFLPVQPTFDQLTQIKSNQSETLSVKAGQVGQATPNSEQSVLPDIQQTLEIETLRQSAQRSMQRPMLSNQDASIPERATEAPVTDQNSQIPALPATAEVSDIPPKTSEPTTGRQPASGIQPGDLAVTAPVKNCWVLGGDRYARAIAELPELGTVQVVMTRNNSDVTVNLQASQQSLPTLDSCASTLHQLVSDSIQQTHLPGNPAHREEPGGTSTPESELKITFSLTTPDHSGSDRGKQHPSAGEWAGNCGFSDSERGMERGMERNMAALAPRNLQDYRSSIALSQHTGTTLIDLHV